MGRRAWDHSSPALLAGAAAILGLATPAWADVDFDSQAVFSLLLLLPAVLLTLTALNLVLWVLAPGVLTATCRAISHGRGRCLLTGLLTVAGGVLLVSMIGPHGSKAGGAVAALLIGLLALGALTGITSVTALLGQGVIDLAGRGGSRAAAVALGTVLLYLTLLIPFVGWVLGAYLVLVGLGGVLHVVATSGR